VANIGTKLGTHLRTTNIAIERNPPGILPWIFGLVLLALLLAGLIFSLRTPRAVGVDDGTKPAGNVQERQSTPRSLRQYAQAPPAPGAETALRAA
jgi:hypothetical protein